MTMKVGFIGLGIMGKPMSKNLLKAGYSLVVADRNPEAIADVIAAGAETASTAKAIAEQCDVIITITAAVSGSCAPTPWEVSSAFARSLI
ncbi:NAD(P)-binding domain-containing protein, partial [Escherichia sp. TWPC-MK]